MYTSPWMVLALLIVATFSDDARAQDAAAGRGGDTPGSYADSGDLAPGWLCIECRDPTAYPGDFAAFAWNAYFGENPWGRDSMLGIPFRVYNTQLQWVMIWFEDVLFDPPSLLPDTMNIMLRLPSGEIISITVLENGPDLPINDAVPTTGTAECSCAGGVGDDDDEAEPDEGYEWEEPEPQGIVDIVDPDESGEFPEWEREL